MRNSLSSFNFNFDHTAVAHNNSSDMFLMYSFASLAGVVFTETPTSIDEGDSAEFSKMETSLSNDPNNSHPFVSSIRSKCQGYFF